MPNFIKFRDIVIDKDEIVGVVINKHDYGFNIKFSVQAQCKNNFGIDIISDVFEIGEARKILDEFYEVLNGNTNEAGPKEPEVDWENLPVDTLVLVKDAHHEFWYPRYFAGYDRGSEYSYKAYVNGGTSLTSKGNTESWECARIPTQEEIEKYARGENIV